MYILQLYHNAEFSQFCKTPSTFAANHYGTATPPPFPYPPILENKNKILDDLISLRKSYDSYLGRETYSWWLLFVGAVELWVMIRKGTRPKVENT